MAGIAEGRAGGGPGVVDYERHSVHWARSIDPSSVSLIIEHRGDSLQYLDCDAMESLCSLTLVALKVDLQCRTLVQARNRDFTLGAHKLRGCTFSQKKLTTFFSRRPQNLSSGSTQDTSGTQDSVTLLNEAGHTSQQSQFCLLRPCRCMRTILLEAVS